MKKIGWPMLYVFLFKFYWFQFNKQTNVRGADRLTEWLRRWTARPIQTAGVDLNPIFDD